MKSIKRGVADELLAFLQHGRARARCAILTAGAARPIQPARILCAHAAAGPPATDGGAAGANS
jgi:hypothetical protein